MAKILIIGGGVAGLSAGIYARLHGHEAIVCERHSVAGGNLTGWQREGYHIDNCIHWLTGTNPSSKLYGMWEDLGVLGAGINVFQGNSLYTCEYEGRTLSLHRDLKKFKAELLEISPEDKRQINSMIKAIEELQMLMNIAGDDHDRSLDFAGSLALLPSLVKYYNLTTGDLAKKFKSPHIGHFLTSFITDRFGSLALLFVIANFCADNGGVPEGGSSAMASRMSERLVNLGGQLLFRKEARKINLSGGLARSVTFADGSTIDADYVVIATDPASAFPEMIEAKMPKKLAKGYKSRELMRFSSYHCAFACDLAELPFEGDFTFELPENYKKRLLTDHLIIRGFSHEKGYAPEGKQIIQTLTYCNEKTAKKFIKLRQEKKHYANVKKHLSALISRSITEKFPEMKEKIRCIDVWTPATYKRYVGSEMGSWMSFAFAHKIPPMLKNGIKGIKNVVIATQWQFSPGGLPLAATSGLKAIKTINKREKKLGTAKA